MFLRFSLKGRPLRTSAQNREKLTPPTLSFGHTINFEKSEAFCIKKCGHPHLKNPLPFVRKMSALDKPPECGRPSLWTAPYVLFLFYKKLMLL